MTNIEINFIVISLLHWKMQQQLHGEEVLINPDDVWTWRESVERATGLAIVNAFEFNEIEAFLKYGKGAHLFQEQNDEKHNFVFKKDDLSNMPSWPNVTAALLEFFDPRLNYPTEVIEASYLLPVLESKD